MAVTYATSLKTDRMTQVKNHIDAGSGPGVLEICSAAYAAILASITLADPCGAVTADYLDFTMPQTDPSADNTGTAAIARIKDSDGNVVISGITVGTSGADLILASTSIVQGNPVTIQSARITHG